MPKLTVHKLGEAIVFRCTGRIGFGECHILRHAVFSHPHIAIAVLNMAEVTAIDASGLGLLAAARRVFCCSDLPGHNLTMWSSRSRRQFPTQRSATPFCHGLRIEVCIP